MQAGWGVGVAQGLFDGAMQQWQYARVEKVSNGLAKDGNSKTNLVFRTFSIQHGNEELSVIFGPTTSAVCGDDFPKRGRRRLLKKSESRR